MTDDQLTNIYLTGAAVQAIYILYTIATKRNDKGVVKITTLHEEAKKEGFDKVVWPMFFFFGAMTIMFWPLWLINKVISIGKKGIWK
ncbi:hypothetical protein D3C75_465230 [compost metagenome]